MLEKFHFLQLSEFALKFNVSFYSSNVVLYPDFGGTMAVLRMAYRKAVYKTVSNAFKRSRATETVLSQGRLWFSPRLIWSWMVCRAVVVLYRFLNPCCCLPSFKGELMDGKSKDFASLELATAVRFEIMCCHHRLFNSILHINFYYVIVQDISI